MNIGKMEVYIKEEAKKKLNKFFNLFYFKYHGYVYIFF